MIYNVSSGTLNSTIAIPRIPRIASQECFVDKNHRHDRCLISALEESSRFLMHNLYLRRSKIVCSRWGGGVYDAPQTAMEGNYKVWEGGEEGTEMETFCFIGFDYHGCRW